MNQLGFKAQIDIACKTRFVMHVRGCNVEPYWCTLINNLFKWDSNVYKRSIRKMSWKVL